MNNDNEDFEKEVSQALRNLISEGLVDVHVGDTGELLFSLADGITLREAPPVKSSSWDEIPEYGEDYLD